VLPNRTTVHEGPILVVVEHVTIDFATGDTHLGRIVGGT
jgi:hypothetical protein